MSNFIKPLIELVRSVNTLFHLDTYNWTTTVKLVVAGFSLVTISELVPTLSLLQKIEVTLGILLKFFGLLALVPAGIGWLVRVYKRFKKWYKEFIYNPK